MIEIFLLLGALAGIGNRAHQRGLNRATYIAWAASGWGLFLVLTAVGLGPISLLLRWAAVGVVYLMVEGAHSGAAISESWQCPDCRLFNEPKTLICLCGFVHPEAPPGAGPAAAA